MKKLVQTIFILLLFFAQCVSSQTAKWSQPLTDNKKVPYMLILGANDDGYFYVLRSNISLESGRERSGFRSRSYLLQYFSPDMNMVWEKDLKTSYEEGHISDVRLVNGHVVVTSYIVDKKNKIYYFYTQYFGSDGNWVDKPFPVDSFATEYFDEDNKPGLIASHSQSWIAFSYRKITKDKNSQSFHVVVLDTNLSVKYTKEIVVPGPQQLFVPLDYVLTDEASFFVLGIRYTTEKKIKAPDQSFYELYGYNYVLGRDVNTLIKSENKFVTDVGISTDNIKHSIVVAGFYSDKTTYSIAGVFYYALTEDSLHETKTINTPFSAAYLQKFVGEKKENKELVNYSIDRLIVRKDGGVAIIAESMYQTTRSYFDYYMQSFVSHYYYHFGDIMVLSVNPDGNILWNNVISKDQNSVDDAGFYSSYFSAITGGMLAAVYNKYIEDESSVLVTLVDGTGVQKTDVLFNELEKVSIVPRSARQIDDETILIPAYKQNKFYLVQLSF